MFGKIQYFPLVDHIWRVAASRHHNAWQHTWFFFPFQDACETRRPFHNPAATLRIYHCKRFAYHTLSGTWMQRVRIMVLSSQGVVSQISRRWSTSLCIGNEILCRTSDFRTHSTFWIQHAIKSTQHLHYQYQFLPYGFHCIHGRVEVVWICHWGWLLRLLRCWAFPTGRARGALSML